MCKGGNYGGAVGVRCSALGACAHVRVGSQARQRFAWASRTRVVHPQMCETVASAARGVLGPGRCSSAQACLHGCQPGLGPVWVPTCGFYGYWLALGGILAIESVLISPPSRYRPHRGEQVRLLVPTARKVLVSTITQIVRSFDRSLRYNVGSYVCRII